MAAHSAKRSVHKTLVAGTEDVVTLTQRWDMVEVLNRHATEVLTFRSDGVAAVVLADNTITVLPGQGVTVSPDAYNASGQTVINVISAGAATYSVHGLR